MSLIRFACAAVVTAAVALILAAPAGARLTGFQSENHAVGCYINGQGVRCDARDPKWDPPPRPPACQLDWGQGVVVARRGPPSYVCAGDTTLDPSHEELAKGERIARGRFVCKARGRASIKCMNKRNGAGFAISRGDVRLFD